MTSDFEEKKRKGMVLLFVEEQEKKVQGQGWKSVGEEENLGWGGVGVS